MTTGTLTLKSPAFKDGGFIPSKFTCDSDDVNPMLEIRNVPAGAKSLALILDDPDATRGTTWDHWLVWNIDPRTQYLSEDSVPDDAVQGMTSFGHSKYGGPCPPIGSKPHHYHFKLFALDTMLALPAGATKAELEAAMTGHTLESTTLIGVFSH